MKRPIRVLHCLGTLNPGGVETWLLHLLRHVDRRELQFDFCLFGSEAGLYAPEAQRLGAKLHFCERSPVASLGGRFQKILQDGRYDVVHSHVHLFSGALLRRASMVKVPMRIAHSHSSCDGGAKSMLRGAYRKLMRHWIGRYATHRLAVSARAAQNLFPDQAHDERVRIHHYGIDLRPFRGVADCEKCREQAGLRAGVPVIGHVGNFVPAKNHDFFLEIAAAISRIRPEVQFLMVGDGALRPQIEMRAKKLALQERMLFLGTRTDVPGLLRSCMDTFLFPSLWEGLPLAVIEAQAAGLQCVISDEISEEAVVLPRQLVRIPLSAPPAKWAAAVVEKMDCGKLDAAECSEAIAKTDFCIEQSLSRMLRLYSGAEARFDES